MNESVRNGRVGETRRRETVGPFVLTEVTYPPNLRLRTHTHEMNCIGLTLKGSSVESFGSLQLQRSEDTVLFRPAGERHGDLIGRRGAKCFLVEFDDPRTLHLDSGPLRSVLPSTYQRQEMTGLALRAYREWVQRDEVFELIIKGLFYEMMGHIVRAKNIGKIGGEPPPWLRRVQNALNDCYTEKLCLEDLARIGGVHAIHVARSFRQHFGTNVGNYLRHRRIQAAKDQLLNTRKTLTEIALESGFSSHAHFCGIFKRVTGLTPTEFRRSRGC